ncbi:amidase [Arthrobacter sp. MA-N2]|uniref:amidase n=1 Tax=Arthrobacter sp. MA-N2 TaxID=1101188 RepID=UPI0004B316A1|nr:amidase [Arthrobacter sp. MA-N2]
MNVFGPWPLLGLIEQLQSGQVSATDAVGKSLDRIHEVEDVVSAWVRVDADGALRDAAALDRIPPSERKPLHGVPIGVKDIIDVAGLPTRCGSILRQHHVAASDASLVRKLRTLGAIVMGKTVTTEFAYFSPGPTSNPSDARHTPGGSSSGSAAAVAAGMVPLALGSQTAASVARPAAYCGVAAHVTAPGDYPHAGITGLSSTLDAVGFFTAGIEDLRVVDRVGRGPAPVQAAPLQVRMWQPGSSFEVADDMASTLESAGEMLKRSGLEVRPLNFDVQAEELVDAHMTVMAYESVRLRSEEAQHPESLSEPLRLLFRRGRTIEERAYISALESIRELKSGLRSELQGALVLAPAAQSHAPVGLESTGNPLLSRPWQALGLPTVVVPGARGQSGMPLGHQFVGFPGQEGSLFAAGTRLESLWGI